MSAKPQQIQVAGCNIMVDGLKAEYHIIRHQTKQQTCPFDAGIDLFPSKGIDQSCVKYVGRNWNKIVIPTLVHMTFPAGVYGLIMERSSTVDKLLGGRVVPSVIDAGYTGELLVRVMCHTTDSDEVYAAVKAMADGEIAIAQMVPTPVMFAMFAKLDHAQLVGQRGSNGFGSTDRLIKP